MLWAMAPKEEREVRLIHRVFVFPTMRYDAIGGWTYGRHVGDNLGDFGELRSECPNNV